MTNFNNGLEASSDSDDEDKLHIVEEDSLQEPEAAAAATAAEGAPLQDSHDAAATVLPHNGLNGGRGRCGVSLEAISSHMTCGLVTERLLIRRSDFLCNRLSRSKTTQL